jgi:predicted 3-demethylubiquinone-9 3-methyltransferase (glyoxalase superfamily)
LLQIKWSGNHTNGQTIAKTGIKKISNMAIVQKITPNFWFANEAEEAAKYYTSIFKNSRMGKITHYVKEGQEHHNMPEGSVMTVQFWLEGQEFMALNGGPIFKFNESVSFIVNCETQEEVDYYWEKLTAGGDKNAQQCGWLKDKFGLSWQVVPVQLNDMFDDSDVESSSRVMKAMMQMKKLDLPALEKAKSGK